MTKQDKSPARICHQVAALVPDMFCDCCLVKKPKIANNAATAEARKNKHIFQILRMFEIF